MGNWFSGVGEAVTVAFGVGVKLAPAGTVCCGCRVALIGSYGRLVINRAPNVANAAAAITMMAAQTSVFL